METIYFDNAATSWPKPAAVSTALSEYFGEAGGNPGRSGHHMSIAAARIVENTREALARLFHASDPSRIVFASNATHALNTALYGLLKPGDRVVTTGVEHNSVMRPLRHMQSIGIDLKVVRCAPDGTLDPGDIERALQKKTRLLVATHASNVTGALTPIAELGKLAHETGALLLVDAAQTAGSNDIDVEGQGIDLLAFTGHKALLGPTGTGGLYIREGVTLGPLVRGGTGSNSAHEFQPEFLPDAYESGTPNVLGIAGLGASVNFLLETQIEMVRSGEMVLVRRFLSGAASIPGVILYGPERYGDGDAVKRSGVVSFNIAGAVPSEVGVILEQSFGILARTGLQCAPAAHRTIGTFPQGTVRFSFGYFNTHQEIDAGLEALERIAEWVASGTPARRREV